MVPVRTAGASLHLQARGSARGRPRPRSSRGRSPASLSRAPHPRTPAPRIVMRLAPHPRAAIHVEDGARRPEGHGTSMSHPSSRRRAGSRARRSGVQRLGSRRRHGPVIRARTTGRGPGELPRDRRRRGRQRGARRHHRLGRSGPEAAGRDDRGGERIAHADRGRLARRARRHVGSIGGRVRYVSGGGYAVHRHVNLSARSPDRSRGRAAAARLHVAAGERRRRRAVLRHVRRRRHRHVEHRGDPATRPRARTRTARDPPPARSLARGSRYGGGPDPAPR